jgi:hypothetical protein
VVACGGQCRYGPVVENHNRMLMEAVMPSLWDLSSFLFFC